MQNLCQTSMQCLYHGSGCEGTPIVAFLPFDIKGIKSCLWLYLASRGILGAQSNNYWQKTERVSLRRKEEEKYLQIVAEPAISVERSEWSAEWWWCSNKPLSRLIFHWGRFFMKVKKHAFFSETFGGLLAHFGFMKQEIHWFYSIFLFCPLTKYWCNKTWSTQFPRIFGNGSVKTSVSSRWYRTFWPQGTDSTL